jgi:hypothetical protein
MRIVISVLATLLFSLPVLAQTPPSDLSAFGVTIAPDRRVMTVLAALEAARTTDDKGDPVPVIRTPLSKEGAKFRELLASDLAALDPAVRERISSFVIQHKKRYPTATDSELVAPFISMAYALSPTPDLGDPVVTSDLPGALLDVLDFAPLVREFYRRSSFSANLDEYVKAYNLVADKALQASSRAMVADILGYLHTRPQTVFTERIKTQAQKANSKKTVLERVETRERDRRFMVVPEMLAPTGNIQFINVKDDYAIIVPPDLDIGFTDARRGFLRYVIDPIILDRSKEVAAIRDSVKTLLDERRKDDPTISPDVYLMISRSLVSAADVRQLEYTRSQIATAQARRKLAQLSSDAEKKAVTDELQRYKNELADESVLRLWEDHQKGAVLAFYFADQIRGLEDSGFDIASSMREILLSFDAAKESARIAGLGDTVKRAQAAREARRKAGPERPQLAAVDPLTAKLEAIEKTIGTGAYDAARVELTRLAAAHPDEPRIFYNLGRVASRNAESLTEPEAQRAKLIEAKNGYDAVLKIAEKNAVDPALRSLTYVELGKIYEFYDETEYAKAIYEKAIGLGRVPGGAYDEALVRKQRLLKEQ